MVTPAVENGKLQYKTSLKFREHTFCALLTPEETKKSIYKCAECVAKRAPSLSLQRRTQIFVNLMNKEATGRQDAIFKCKNELEEKKESSEKR